MSAFSPNPDVHVARGVRLIGNYEEQNAARPRIGTPEFERWQDTGELPVAKLIGGYEEVTENGDNNA